MHPIRPRVAQLLLLALTPIAAAAQAPVDVVTTRPAVSPAPPIARALAAVQVGRVEADLTFLSSDELGGRDTPSTGQRIAARYIRTRLERLGFRPGAPNGYFYDYELENTKVLEPDSHATIERDGVTSILRLGEDYFFHNRRLRNGEFSGPVVFCGKGTAEELEGVDLTDAWALCVASETNWRKRRTGVQRAGAIGLLVMPDPDGDPEAASFVERFGPWVERMRKGRVSWPRREAEASEKDAATAKVETPASQGESPAEEGAKAQVEATAQVEASAKEEPQPEEPKPAPKRRFLADAYVTADVARSLGFDANTALGAVLPGRYTEKRAIDASAESVALENVCGFWPGSDPVLAQEVIILSAHYDHVGIDGSGDVFNGADDNGSGTSGLLAVAEALAAHGPMRRSILLMWVSAEEKGLLGSKAWTLDPWLPDAGRPVCNINIDMIGRNAPEQVLITPSSEREEYNGLVRLAEKHAPAEGFTELGGCDQYWGRSDHANFSRNLGIPVAFLFTDVHEDYHKVSDTVDKIDFDKLRRVVRLVVRIVADLQDDALEL